MAGRLNAICPLLRHCGGHAGFTLVELMICVMIVGILAAIGIPQFTAYQRRGYASSTRSDTRNAYTAVKAWFAVDSSHSSSLADNCIGPDSMANYSPSKCSKGVTVIVTGSTSEDSILITGLHDKLAGVSYIILGGSVTDTLSSAF